MTALTPPKLGHIKKNCFPTNHDFATLFRKDTLKNVQNSQLITLAY